MVCCLWANTIKQPATTKRRIAKEVFLAINHSQSSVLAVIVIIALCVTGLLQQGFCKLGIVGVGALITKSSRLNPFGTAKATERPK